jgi:hypothetical protein
MKKLYHTLVFFFLVFTCLIINEIYSYKVPSPVKHSRRSLEQKKIEPYLKKYNITIDKPNTQLIYNNKTINYKTYFNENNLKYAKYANDKSKSNIIFEKYNIPYPKYVNALRYKYNKDTLNYPVLLKPIRGKGGEGMIDNINNRNELDKHMGLINKKNYIIQEQKKGKKYRILILNNNILSVKYDIPPFIIGNGIDTVNTLIEMLNNKLKKDDGNAYVKRISHNYIKEQGYTQNSILEKGKKLYITNIINYWNGSHNYKYYPIDQIHPINIDFFLSVCKAFDLMLCGIDYITKSLKEPYYLTDGNVLEINTGPSYTQSVNLYPDRFFQALLDNQ